MVIIRIVDLAEHNYSGQLSLQRCDSQFEPSAVRFTLCNCLSLIKDFEE